MKLKKLIVAGVGYGVILGLVLGVAGVYSMDIMPLMRPPFDAIITPRSNQKIATDFFTIGAVRRVQGAPEDQRACEGIPIASSIFCFEGYWYAKVLEGLQQKDETILKVPADEKPFVWTGSPAVARDTFITAYGLALADGGEEPKNHKAQFSSAKDYGHLVDGWIFMRAHTLGLQGAADLCAIELADVRPSCEFGVGRAAWFEADGAEWIKNQADGYKHGFNFAKNFTSQKPASELESVQPKEVGEKIGLIDKMLWLRSPAKDQVSAKLYACQGQSHPANCAVTHQGLIQ